MGLRQPFRMTMRPGTNDLWIGDVGWNTWEEIDRVANPKALPIENFGWPCYEGVAKQPGYNALNLDICNTLYGSGAAIPPYYKYNHTASVVSGDNCPTGGSSVTGGAFYPASGGNYPSKYNGALFFADYTRRCIWVMLKGSNGLPDPTKIESFASGTTGAYSPVDLVTGPGGRPLLRGPRRRDDPAHPLLPGQPPARRGPRCQPEQRRDAAYRELRRAAVDRRRRGFAELLVGPRWRRRLRRLDAAEPDPHVHDGGNDHRLGARHRCLQQPRCRDGDDQPGNTLPVPTIDTPSPSFTWSAGDTISFSGSASDAQDGTLPASALTWTFETQHCPTVDTCHIHPGETFAGVTSGSFVAQSHDYPSHLRLSLTATDSGGLSQTTFVDLYPNTSTLTLASDPAGATLALGSITAVAPFSTTVITGGIQSISAPDQTIDGQAYVFAGWSDGGASSHDITVSGDTTLTATFTPAPP